MSRINYCFPVLRDQLRAIRMGYAELAGQISRSERYVSARMRGCGSFTIDEAYAIRSAVGLTGRTIEEVFPNEN